MNKKILIKLSGYTILIIFFATLYFHSQRSICTTSKAVKNKTIIIDAGHGLPDSGASSQDGTAEKDLNLQIAGKLKKILSEKGFKTIMTRNDDNSLSTSKSNNKRADLNARKNLIKNSSADVFVSIHMNYFPDSRYSGAQVFYNDCLEENLELATAIQNNLIEIADPENTRVQKLDNSIYILKNSSIPSVLVECGFLSNKEEADKLKTTPYQNKIAKSIYFGIMEYLKNSSNK